MTPRRLFLLSTLFLLLAAGAAFAVTPTEDELTAERTRIESGEGLTPRGRKILFRAANHQQDGQHAETVEIVAEWLRGHPERDHALLRFTAGISLLALEQPDSARAQLAAAVRLEPNFARAWLRLGEGTHALGDHAAAADAFGRAYDLSPEHSPEVLYYAAVERLNAGDAAQAADDLVRLLDGHAAAMRPDWVRALVAAAASAGRPERAAPYVDRLLAAHSGDPEVWELAYRAAAAREDYRAAAVLLAVTGYLRPLSRAEASALGDLYAVNDVPLQAARCYEQALAAAPPVTADPETGAGGRAVAHERLAASWLAAHRPAEARAALRRALDEGETASLWTLLGDLEYMTENFEPALTAFARACALDPTFGRGHLMAGYCAQELGRIDEARGHLEKALAFPEQAAGARRLLETAGHR